MITRTLVLMFVLVSGPWLVRQIALRLRHYSLTDGRVPPMAFAILMGLCATLPSILLIEGLLSGSVHCFARNCQGEIYHLASSPTDY